MCFLTRLPGGVFTDLGSLGALVWDLFLDLVGSCLGPVWGSLASLFEPSWPLLDAFGILLVFLHFVDRILRVRSVCVGP